VDSEGFIRGLAAALPEAFAERDLEAEYYTDWGEPELRWLSYVALADARIWIEENALKVDPVRRVARVRPGAEDAVRRYFGYVEPLAADPDRSMENLLMIELFEGVVWVQDVIDYVGPDTRALLARAQVQLADANSAIGRWREPSAPKRRGARLPRS
jgi:hypothetical protein